MFIMIDGIDGSGKSTVVKCWAEELERQGKKVFHLKSYWAEHHAHPKPEELLGYDVIISAEPTNVWVGAAIRQEMIQNGSSYSTHAIASAFALDRLILYTRLLNPLRKEGKIIIQDRGVSTSLCYQPLQDAAYSMQDIAKIEGNAFALEYAPDHLVLADTPASNAITRIGGRVDKRDNAVFEQEQFLQKAHDRFLDPKYQNYFTSRHTRVHILNTDCTLDIMKQRGIDLLSALLGPQSPIS